MLSCFCCLIVKVCWFALCFFFFVFSSIEEVIAKFSQVTPEERTKKFVICLSFFLSFFRFLSICFFRRCSLVCFLFYFCILKHRKVESLEVSCFTLSSLVPILECFLFGHWFNCVCVLKAQTLKKTFLKLDHTVNIRELIASRWVGEDSLSTLQENFILLSIWTLTSSFLASLVSVIQQQR